MLKIKILIDGGAKVAQLIDGERVAKEARGSAEFVELVANEWAEQYGAEIVRE